MIITNFKAGAWFRDKKENEKKIKGGQGTKKAQPS